VYFPISSRPRVSHDIITLVEGGSYFSALGALPTWNSEVVLHYPPTIFIVIIINNFIVIKLFSDYLVPKNVCVWSVRWVQIWGMGNNYSGSILIRVVTPNFTRLFNSAVKRECKFHRREPKVKCHLRETADLLFKCTYLRESVGFGFIVFTGIFPLILGCASYGAFVQVLFIRFS